MGARAVRAVGSGRHRRPDEPGPAGHEGRPGVGVWGNDAVSNDIEITVRGWVATAPRLLETGRVPMMRMRLGSTPRRYDAVLGGWANGVTEWFSVVAFRELADNAARSLRKGDPVLLRGRLRMTRSERDGKEYASNEIVADSIGPDLGYGTTLFARTARRGRDGGPGGDQDAVGVDAAGVDDGSGSAEFEDGGGWREDPESELRFEAEIADLEDALPSG